MIYHITRTRLGLKFYRTLRVRQGFCEMSDERFSNCWQAPQRSVWQSPADSEHPPIMNRALASRHSASRISDAALSKLICIILLLLLYISTLHVRFPSSEDKWRFVISVSPLLQLEDAIWTQYKLTAENARCGSQIITSIEYSTRNSQSPLVAGPGRPGPRPTKPIYYVLTPPEWGG